MPLILKKIEVNSGVVYWLPQKPHHCDFAVSNFHMKPEYIVHDSRILTIHRLCHLGYFSLAHLHAFIIWWCLKITLKYMVL